MTLRWETLTTESVPAWTELTNLLGRVDGTEEFYSAEDLAEELTEHGFDPAKDSVAVWDGERLVAFSQLQLASALTHGEGHVRAGLAGGVHPDYRGQGIATAMFQQMEPRALELAASLHPGAPIDLRVEAGLETDPVRALLTDRGYAPARYFTVMRRTLPGAPLEPVDPRTQPLTEELQEATRLAHNDAFASHWGSAPISAQRWKGVISGHAARPAFARVALDAGGTVLAYCTTGQWVDRELYVTLVGTRQAARGQGLARAVLGATLAAAVEAGSFDVIELDVDSANPGAGALYTSLGFAPVRTTATFVKPVPAAGR